MNLNLIAGEELVMTYTDSKLGDDGGLDRSSPLPLYYQLKQILLKHIQSDAINPGDLLPSEKELEEKYGVSQITVRRALQDLTVEGHIVRKAGQGSFVRQTKLEDRSATLGGFVKDLEAQGYKVESQILDHGMRLATAQVAEKLSLEGAKDLFYLKRLVLADDEPIAITTAYLDVELSVSFTADELSSDSIFPLLQQKYGIRLPRAQKSIEVTVTLEDEAELLCVPPNSPAMLTELIVYNERDQRKGFVKTVYRGDRYKYYISVGR
jgi:GntR family transcriptional regulator